MLVYKDLETNVYKYKYGYQLFKKAPIVEMLSILIPYLLNLMTFFPSSLV